MAMQKVKDDDKFSVYMARLQCLLLNEQRYIVALVPRDRFPPTHRQPLGNLHWLSLQIRNLEEGPDIAPQSYNMKRTAEFQRRIKVSTRNEDVTTYTIDDLPVQLSLLHTRGNEYEYPNEGSLISALETFRTVVHF
jgi:hypothetical protein